MMYAEEVEEIESFDGLPLRRTGFAFYPDEEEEELENRGNP
jgi:hypothetical protein